MIRILVVIGLMVAFGMAAAVSDIVFSHVSPSYELHAVFGEGLPSTRDKVAAEYSTEFACEADMYYMKGRGLDTFMFDEDLREIIDVYCKQGAI